MIPQCLKVVLQYRGKKALTQKNFLLKSSKQIIKKHQLTSDSDLLNTFGRDKTFKNSRECNF